MGPSQPDPSSPPSAEDRAQLDARSPERIARAAQAAELLSRELWGALHEELRGPHANGPSLQVAELAERLAQVSAAVAALARRSVPAALEIAGQPGSVAPSAGDPFPDTRTSSPEIAIRDARGEGPSVWVQAVGCRLERYRRDAQPFAVLLLEVAGDEQPRGAEPAAEIAYLHSRVEGALRQELRPVDDVTLESPGRWWLTLARLDARAARAVAERAVETLHSLARELGASPQIAIGIASCPEDGHDAATLAAHADVSLYAARAAGRALPPA